MEKTANRLKQLRGQKHLTLQELSSFLSKAKGIYISPDSLAKYERGERKPKIDKLEALANFFKVPVSYLRGESNPNRIKEMRQQAGLSLAEVGKGVGLATNTISRYETGQREPNLKTWKKLADFFGTTVSYLQGEDTILEARDLFFEISILADLYPGLHEQLKAIEDHYGIEYGYEELKKDWSYSNEDQD